MGTRNLVLTRWLAAALLAVGFAAAAPAQRAEIPTRTREPYLGAIVVDAVDGRVLFERDADVTCYPASAIKLMTLLLVLEDVQRGAVALTDPVTTTAEAAAIGGSQVYLRERETFPLEEMLYAIAVQSANDAAAAVAISLAGSRPAWVARMNRRAQELGMGHTALHSVHGLPPAAGQQPDTSTPRDLALLGRALLRQPDALRYTSTRKRGFRNNTFEMSNHNNLLGQGGCDGLKTGYFRAGGYSIVATAAQGDRRVVAVVVGSASKVARDQATAQLLAEGLAAATPLPSPAAPAVLPAKAAPVADAPALPPPEEPVRKAGWGRRILVGVAVAVGALLLYRRSRRLADF